jgi:hypothetical protein
MSFATAKITNHNDIAVSVFMFFVQRKTRLKYYYAGRRSRVGIVSSKLVAMHSNVRDNHLSWNLSLSFLSLQPQHNMAAHKFC